MAKAKSSANAFPRTTASDPSAKPGGIMGSGKVAGSRNDGTKPGQGPVPKVRERSGLDKVKERGGQIAVAATKGMSSKQVAQFKVGMRAALDGVPASKDKGVNPAYKKGHAFARMKRGELGSASAKIFLGDGGNGSDEG